MLKNKRNVIKKGAKKVTTNGVVKKLKKPKAVKISSNEVYDSIENGKSDDSFNEKHEQDNARKKAKTKQTKATVLTNVSSKLKKNKKAANERYVSVVENGTSDDSMPNEQEYNKGQPRKIKTTENTSTVAKKLNNKKEAKISNNEDYDSMVENGTSDDSSSDDEETNNKQQVLKKSKYQPAKTPLVKRKPETNVVAAQASSKKPKVVEKIKPPTLEEINELKETRNLFHSNLFRLQVKEMLAELKIKDKYKNFINTWLEQFNGFLKSLQPTNEDEVKTKQWLLETTQQVPFSLQQLRIKTETDYPFRFVPPTEPPYLVGAAATQSLLGPKLVADICIQMPAECFIKGDYLNLIYEQKRAFYLTYIATELSKHDNLSQTKSERLKFNYFANNPLKPVLEITPASKLGSIAQKLTFRIFCAADAQAFKLSRFVPWNNNIRMKLFSEEDDEEEMTEPATANYNANVLHDLTMEQNQRLLRESFSSHTNFQEGLVLLKVWLRQRQLGWGYSGFNAHILAMFMVYLFKQRKLHANMSSYQVARTVWIHLAHSAWEEKDKGITLCEKRDQPNLPDLTQFHAYYDIVFIDVTGFYNICANLSVELYRRVRGEAKLAVDLLNDMKLNSFQLIFMTKYPLYMQFDHILKINQNDAIEQMFDMHISPADKCNYAGYAYPQLLKVITNLLRKGLGQRIQALLPIEQVQESWCTIDAPTLSHGEYLQLGIILNPEQAFEVLDKGPESIADAAIEFRKFWGEKAELRRFQDGSITESVVWASSTDTLSKKRLIVRTIILHLLQHHFQLEPKDVTYIAGEFDVAYRLTLAFKTERLSGKQAIAQDTDAEAMCLPVIRCFDDLGRKLHALDELPLEIVSIAGISPVFRYCEPTPVLPTARCIQGQLYATSVQHGVMQLGLSGKWPNDLDALRALKTAFYIKIAQLLREKHHLHTKVTYEGVLVLKQGYCFAIELAHPKEIGLLKKAKTEKGITQYVDCEASVALEKRHYILPKLTGALHGLHQQYASFGGTVMIAKRWLYAQLIDNGLWPDECTELLIAGQYLKCSANQVTCSPQTGFLRFLHLLATTEWKSELFFVNFNNSSDAQELTDLEQRFSTARDTFPPLCIATSYDQQHCGRLWSNNEQPNNKVLARVTILARQTLAIIEQSLLSPTEPFVKPHRIFTAPNQGYDLVIQLKPELVHNTLAYEFGSSLAALSKPNWRLPLAKTNDVEHSIKLLREAYSQFAAFFYNPVGGKEIAIVWKPHIFEEKEFKVTDVNGCSLTEDGTKIVCKKDTLIEDFKFVLKDFQLRMGSVEEVLQASRESVKLQMANQLNKTNSSQRYFNVVEGKNEKKTLEPKEPIVVALTKQQLTELKGKQKVKKPKPTKQDNKLHKKVKTTQKVNSNIKKKKLKN